jgi:hypothetical protein
LSSEFSGELSGYLAAFRSSEGAIGAERAFRASPAALRGLREELIPLPRDISSDCGFCLLLGLEAGLPGAESAAGEEAASAAEAGILSFLETNGCEEVFRVFESPIPGKRRREKSYERIEIAKDTRRPGSRLP